MYVNEEEAFCTEYRQLAISGSLSKRLELIKWQLASDG